MSNCIEIHSSTRRLNLTFEKFDTPRMIPDLRKALAGEQPKVSPETREEKDHYVRWWFMTGFKTKAVGVNSKIVHNVILDLEGGHSSLTWRDLRLVREQLCGYLREGALFYTIAIMDRDMGGDRFFNYRMKIAKRDPERVTQYQHTAILGQFDFNQDFIQFVESKFDRLEGYHLMSGLEAIYKDWSQNHRKPDELLIPELIAFCRYVRDHKTWPLPPDEEICSLIDRAIENATWLT
jgi:hypothetical protein